MKFDPVKSGKMDPVVLSYRDGMTYLFTYERPLAAYIPGRGYVAVQYEGMSVTNEARIQAWLESRGDPATEFITYDEMVEIFSDHLRRLGNAKE